ncbi:hypothetical protein WMY93_010781 [Mugilogobius chulae]|uniref:2-aminoethanethiol dioxygenase n=1 Tax=Mugilogobius chulae TaxID=88201 RepID=A0AAW0PBV5_9GOBI
MPRDKTPLIQKIAKQASITFKDCLSEANGEHKPLPDQHKQLISLVTALRAADLKLAPRKSSRPGPEGAQSPPVTYMHICETPVFSMGVFLLRSGTSIPLHDHPGMNGMIKVLYGKISSLCRSMLHCVSEYSASSAPCLLTPHHDNLHQIEALGGPAAFLDILAPPYDPENNRDCHYYRILQPSCSTSGSSEETWLLEIPQPEDFWCGGQTYHGPPVSV